MIKLLEVIPALGIGGAERLLVDLANGLAASGFEVSVLTWYEPFDNVLEESLKRNRIGRIWLSKKPGFEPSLVWRLRGLLRDVRPDVIHSHLSALTYLVPASVRMHAGIYHTVHNIAEKETDLVGRIIRSASFGGRVQPIAIGDAISDSLKVLYGLPEVLNVPNGIRVENFNPVGDDRERARRSFGLPSDAFVVCSAGRLVEQKNQRHLLTAFGELLRSGRERAWLLIAGDGPLRSELAAIARSGGFESRVRFLGILPDTARLLHASNVFALTSRWEGNPLTVMEAMAAGLPVVATSVGSVPELVVNGETGFLVSGNSSVETVAGALATLYDSPALSERLGSSALRESARFSIERMNANYARIFRGGVAGPKA